MTWKIIAVGKPALPWARDGIADYTARLSRVVRVEVEYLKDGPPAVLDERFRRAAAGSRLIVMDERGTRHDTASLRGVVDRWEMEGLKGVALLIGGADGHSDTIRKAADESWSLSPLTLQHELALVVLLEQLYRVYSMKRGEPYHR